MLNEMLFETPGIIGAGQNSGFQALNLAIQFGARKIILVGYDMNVEAGIHWHGAHARGLNNPDPIKCARWAKWLDEAAPAIAARGVRVLNASKESALTAYQKMPFEQALVL